MPLPFDQSRYQVRLEWGLDGLGRLAPADVVVVVDVLNFSTTVTDAVARGATVPLDEAAHAVSMNGARLTAAAAASGSLVMVGCLRNAAAVARAVAGEQLQRGRRTSVAVIAAGARVPGAPTPQMRFAVEDQLGAGAVVSALIALGIDHTSPEAAVSCEAFRGLRGALRHVLTASGSGQEMILLGRREEVLAAAELDVVEAVAVLRDAVFTAL